MHARFSCTADAPLVPCRYHFGILRASYLVSHGVRINPYGNLHLCPRGAAWL